MRRWNSGFAHGAGIPRSDHSPDIAVEMDAKELLDAGYGQTGDVRADEFWNEDAAAIVAPCRNINPQSAEGRAICDRLGVSPSAPSRKLAA